MKSFIVEFHVIWKIIGIIVEAMLRCLEPWNNSRHFVKYKYAFIQDEHGLTFESLSFCNGYIDTGMLCGMH